MIILLPIFTTGMIVSMVVSAVRRDLYLLSLYGHYRSINALDENFSMNLSFPIRWYVSLQLLFPTTFSGIIWNGHDCFTDIPRLSYLGVISGKLFHQYCFDVANMMMDVAPRWMHYSPKAMHQDTMMLLYQLRCSKGVCAV